MELKHKTPYTITNQPDHWLYIRPGDEPETAKMAKLGDETLTFANVPLTSVQPASLDRLHKGYPNTATLATEAVLLYKLDPARVQRGATIANQRGMIVLAKRDENGVEIKPDYNVIAVRSPSNPRGWYIVRKGSCTCPDAAGGTVCKHRIAAWIYKELHLRPVRIAYQSGRTGNYKDAQQSPAVNVTDTLKAAKV